METVRLLSAQRQERLLTELRGQGAVRVRDLAREFGVSELTIRRDIAALAERGLVAKVHGGATLPTHSTTLGRPRQAPLRFTIGMVVPSLDFYWPAVVAGARAAAAALGVSIQLRGSSYDADEDRRQMGRLVEAQQVQGLLLAPSLDGDDADEILEWIGHLPVSTILVERQPRRWTPATRHIEWVRSDHSLGLEIAIHHLRQQGHRRIGLVVAQGSPTSFHLRHAWRTAAADPRTAGALAMQETVTTPGERDVIVRILRECRLSKITALIVHSDPHAIAVAQFCAEMGITVPGELAIVSYDDEIAHLADPAITAVRPPKSHVGRLAVELMLSRLLNGDRRPPHGVLLAPDLVVRESSLAPTQRH
ncbi:substrate-binding domain-containing protein [Plantactinospora sp. S1510]|uniref:Substrate-binding domain-containing protein n=1 Tax=Plantactinospora alkalitolerans TaxID=2789879 RepID=A0ABS0GRF5_9ACTN|nr:LacI family DNA-binding transcriptional regulator [Plantactinospora alkalitolerans]MBF9128780.1 substrate-binding domain-containing protein [Plantactinospora alkalitolerans]